MRKIYSKHKKRTQKKISRVHQIFLPGEGVLLGRADHSHSNLCTNHCLCLASAPCREQVEPAFSPSEINNYYFLKLLLSNSKQKDPKDFNVAYLATPKRSGY